MRRHSYAHIVQRARLIWLVSCGELARTSQRASYAINTRVIERRHARHCDRSSTASSSSLFVEQRITLDAHVYYVRCSPRLTHTHTDQASSSRLHGQKCYDELRGVRATHCPPRRPIPRAPQTIMLTRLSRCGVRVVSRALSRAGERL